MRGETRRKARSRYPGDEALRRVSPRRRRERRCMERERGRDPEHRAELPRVPCAACFAADSGAEPAKMRRVAQDCDPTAYMYTPSISPEAVGRIAKRALAGCRKDARIGHFSRYPPTTEGRSPRSGCPSRGASTVAAKQAARCQANQHAQCGTLPYAHTSNSGKTTSP